MTQFTGETELVRRACFPSIESKELNPKTHNAPINRAHEGNFFKNVKKLLNNKNNYQTL